MLSFDPKEQTYNLGIRLIRLAHAAWKNASLAPIARRFIETLASDTQETVHLAQIDNGQVLFIDNLQATGRSETLAKAGKAVPADCTGVGRAMLAFMAPRRLEIALQQQAYFKYIPSTYGSADALIAKLQRFKTSSNATGMFR